MAPPPMTTHAGAPARRTSAASSTPTACSPEERTMPIIESTRDMQRAIYDVTLNAGEPWLYEVKRGQTLRILDLEGNQAVDTLFYRTDDPTERYSAQDTIREQRNLYLTAGSVLMSNFGNPMMTI